MNDFQHFMLWATMIGVGLVIWGIMTIIHLLKDVLAELNLLKQNSQHIVKAVSTTQSSLRIDKRSDPYPDRPRPKAAQHYEGQGTPRKEPGSHAGNVTASGTPVRIGRIARRRAGGSTGDAQGS